jgi:hypothetical protein
MKAHTAASVLLLILSATVPCWSAATTVMETLTVTATAVSTDSLTEMDYNTGLWYCAGANAFLWVNGSVSQSGIGYGGTAYDDGYICSGNNSNNNAEYTMSASTAASTNYELQTNHWLYPAWYEAEYVDGEWEFLYYIDEYGYSTLTAQNFAGSGTVTAPGTDTQSQSDGYYIASTYLYATSSTHVSVLYDNQGPPSACPTTGVWVRQMVLQLVNGSNTALTTNPSIVETYSGMTTNTCGNGSPIPSPCAATANVNGFTGNSQFMDTMSVSQNFCGSGISQNSGCGYSQTSTWALCGSGLTNNIWTSPRTTLSNGVTVNSNSTTFPTGTQLYP